MTTSLYLLPMLVSFSLSILLLVFLIFFTGKKTNENRFSKRHIHRTGISRFGGIALILSFIATIFLDKNLIINLPLIGIILSCVLILFVGVFDDIRPINWKTQLFFQVILVAIVFIAGVRIQYITNPFGGIISFSHDISNLFGFLLAVVWIVFLMNAINWADGIDGISGGVALIASATIFILSLRPEVNQPPVGIITAILFGCFLAFFILNFHPAKIIAGTSGSMFMGFIIAILAFFAGAKIATTLLVLAIPLIDALWVIMQRIMLRESIFIADQRHLHYRLLQLGWSQKKIALFYFLMTVCISIIALNTRDVEKIFAFLIFSSLFVCFLFVITKKIEKININEKNI